MSIVLALLALSFLVFFHELGHFLAAKFFKVGVLEFSIGMGPRILSGVFRNTRYSLKLLPLGGSCAMLGEDAAGSGDFSTAKGEEEEDVLDFDGVVFSKEDLEKYSFEKKPAWQRFIICFGGVWHNFLLAFLFAIILTVNIGTEFPIIGASTVKTPAMESGLQDGDRIVAIAFADGSKRSLATLQELSIFLELHQEDFKKGEIKVTVLREGKKESFSFSPYRDPETGRYRLGVQLKNGRAKANNLFQVFEYSYYEFRFNARIVFDSLAMILRGKVSRQDVMGPVGTVAVIGGAVQQSRSGGLRLTILVLMNLSLMLSVNLGIMNLLPIPALDGGHFLTLVVEAVRGKPLSAKAMHYAQMFGVSLLVLLMLYATKNDIMRIFVGG